MKVAEGKRVLVGVGVNVKRAVSCSVWVLVGVSVTRRVGVRVGVADGEGVIVQVGVSVQVGMVVCEGTTSVAASVVAGSMVAVLVGVAIISAGRRARLPGADQIAGPFTCTIGTGSRSIFAPGPASRKGKTRNKLMLARLCARVTPISERVFSTTRLNPNPTRNTKIKSSHER